MMTKHCSIGLQVNKLFANHRRRQHKHKAIAAQQQQSQQMADKENQQQHLTEGERIEQTVEDIWSKVTGQQQQRHQSIGGGSAEMGELALELEGIY